MSKFKNDELFEIFYQLCKNHLHLELFNIIFDYFENRTLYEVAGFITPDNYNPKTVWDYIKAMDDIDKLKAVRSAKIIKEFKENQKISDEPMEALIQKYTLSIAGINWNVK